MTDRHSVVVMRFTRPDAAPRALRTLERFEARGVIGLRAAAVVERTQHGWLRVTESSDGVVAVDTPSGSLVGMLIEALRRPVNAAGGGSALQSLGRAIPAGSTAVIASVEESAAGLVDAAMHQLAGDVTRRPVSVVLREIDADERALAFGRARGAASCALGTLHYVDSRTGSEDFPDVEGSPAPYGESAWWQRKRPAAGRYH